MSSTPRLPMATNSASKNTFAEGHRKGSEGDKLLRTKVAKFFHFLAKNRLIRVKAQSLNPSKAHEWIPRQGAQK